MAEHQGLPVSGYAPQTDDKVAVVNANKELEERVLRQIERIHAAGGANEQMLDTAFRTVQDAFMWLNRAVFQPTRVKLPEDV